MDLDQGAGDQGMMFGYACDGTEQLMPAAIRYARRLVERQAKLIIKRALPREWLSGARYLVNPTGRFVVGGPRGIPDSPGALCVRGRLRAFWTGGVGLGKDRQGRGASGFGGVLKGGGAVAAQGLARQGKAGGDHLLAIANSS